MTAAPVAEPTIRPAPGHGPLRYTPYEEYLALPETGRIAEWVDGEVISHMPPKTPHARLVQFLSGLLAYFARFFELGEVMVAPYEMKVSPAGAGREPDVMFVARQHNDRITPDKLAGPADLIIEVVSDDSVARDRVDKFEEYEAAGVPEYWILDNRPGLRRPRAEVYQLDETGQYQFVPAGQDRIYRSRAVPGFWINLDWLWADPPPDPLLTFAEIAGLPPDLLARLRELKGQAASR